MEADDSSNKAGGLENKSISLSEARNRIVRSIAFQGLKSSSALELSGDKSFRSVDPNTHEDIYGRYFKTPDIYGDKKTHQSAIEGALYRSFNSILPVIVERQGESTQTTDRLIDTRKGSPTIEKRLASSILVVYEGVESDEYLTRNGSEATADKILCILLPQEVTDKQLVQELRSAGKDIRIINKIIKKRLYGGRKVRMPDYEGEIKQLLQEHNKPLWIHGVRLPTQEDLEKEV